MRSRHLWLLLVLISIAGCASANGGTALYRRDIGTASGPDAVTLAEQVINRRGYEVEHVETTPEIRMLTKWKQRRPLADEQALGITAAESRIIVVGRQRGQTEMGSFYSINMTIENRVRVAGSPDWNEALNTEMFRAYADEISEDYRQLITNIGVRRFCC